MNAVMLGDRVIDLDTGEVFGHGRLRPMELALLAFLAEHPGEIVSIPDLHARVWGYAPTVSSRAAYTTVGRLRALVEPEPDQPRYVLAHRGEGYSLQGAVRLSTDSDSTPQTNLRRPRDPLVGRERELGEVRHRQAPLVTVVGPGGVGKTRLAIEVGRSDLLPGGVWFCEVADAAGEAGLLEAVAHALPPPRLTEPSVASVGQRLADLGPCLIVLDNVDDAAGDLRRAVAVWTEVAPRARLLATSRSRVRAAGEEVIELDPLPPDEAVRLFRDRLARSGARGTADDATERALVDLLDRLPLAIEIAAGNAALLGTQTVLDALLRGRSLPQRGEGRHRSLHDVVRWSWERLDPAGKAALASLAVLEGPFGLPVAEIVLDGDDALEVLATLVDAALVTVSPTERGVSFELLHTVRAFARSTGHVAPDFVWDRLIEVILDRERGLGVRERLRTAMQSRDSGLSVASCRALLARAEAREDLGAERVWLLRAAMLTAIRRGLFEQGLTWLRQWRARFPSPAQQSTLWCNEANMLRQLGDEAGARAAFDAAVDAAHAAGDPVLAIQSLRLRAHLEIDRGDGEAGMATIEAMFACARELPADLRNMAEAVGHDALLRAYIAAGQPEKADHHGALAAEHYRRVDGEEHSALLMDAHRSIVLRIQGRYPEALRLQQRAVDGLRAVEGMRYQDEVGWLLIGLAELVCLLETPRAALPLAERALKLVAHGPFLAWKTNALSGLARVALEAGCTERAVEVLRQRVAMPDPSSRARVERLLDEVQLEGVTAGPARAVRLARRLRQDPELPPDLLPNAAVAEAGLRIGIGELREAAALLRDFVPDAGDDLVSCNAGLLMAEILLRSGQRRESAATAQRVLDRSALPGARARAHGLLALIEALEGGAAGSLPSWDGLGRGHLAVHRGWIAHLTTGEAPDAGDIEVPAHDHALRFFVEEMRGPRPAWLTAA